MTRKHPFKHLCFAALALLASSAAWASDDGVWSVSKSSGEVWLTTQGAQQVSLGSDDVLNPGDTIRTGSNGRVLLTRGAETILIAPNSVIGLPTDAQDGMATTILQRAGSILLDVERRNVKHFEVETPYLAAVVKGTQFRVTIASGSTKVDVSRGQVEVSDFKSGQIAQVTPGQTATSFASGRPGIHLSGSGSFAPIEQGRPRASTIDRVPVPKNGLHAPREAKGSTVRVVGPVNGAPVAPPASPATQQKGAAAAPKHSGVRITSVLGEAKLNVGKATQGLAHGAVPPSGHNDSHKNTIWNENKTAAGNASGNSSATAGPDSTSPAAISATITTAVGSANASANLASSSSDGNSNAGGTGGNSSAGNAGNGNQGKGNANGNGNGNGADAAAQWLNYVAEKHGNRNGNGNGNAYGHDKGNGNGNGNGHDGNGNGNGNGKGKN
jgi:FecR protein